MKRFAIPLLRINANYLHRKYRDFDLLTCFVELWFWRDSHLEEVKALTKALGPPDNPFDELMEDPDCAIGFEQRLELSREIDAKIRDLFKTGQVASRSLNYWIGQDDAARYRCIMWIELPGGRCCFVETRMRTQQFPVTWVFILAEITAFDLFEQIQSVIGGVRAARTIMQLQDRLDYYASHFAHQGSRRPFIPGPQ